MNSVKMFLRLGCVLIIALTLSSFVTPQEINGWYLRGSAPAKYKIGVEKVGTKKVGYIKSIQKSITIKEFGTIMQSFIPKAYYGKKVKLSARIKSSKVNGWGGMWMRVDGEGRKTLSFDNMRERPIKGSKNWKVYEITLDVPKESTNVSYGVLLAGTGQLWVDDFQFKVVGQAAKTKAKKIGNQPTKPINPSFEK